MKTLTEAELDELLEREPEWKSAGGIIVRMWKFKDFVEAMAFVNRVAAVAEQAGHHPDIEIHYNRVTLGLVTHDAGGVTSRDAAMAATLSDTFGNSQQSG